MGYSFTYPIIRILAPDVQVGAYVHYPTVSTTMLQRVKERTENYANKGFISQSGFLSRGKLLYASISDFLA
jgi:alpha-1,2-mannosyltransferase